MTTVVRGQASVNYKDGLKYLHVDTLHVDLVVKKVRLGVTNIFRNNRILSKL